MLGAVLVLSFVKGSQERPLSTDTLQVVATFYPLAFVAERIGGSAVEVTNLTTGGQEPHEFEPTAHDLISMQNADLLLTLGQVDAWADGVVSERTQAGKPVVVISQSIAFNNNDPHVWLDPVRMKGIVLAVQQALAEQSPAQASDFQHNAVTLLADLDLLDADYRVLTDCSRDDIMVAHDAFGYLADRYGFVSHAVNGLSPDTEPSARDLAGLTDLAKQLQVTTIFFESTASPAIAETLAKEVGAKTDVLATLESLTAADLAEQRDYFSLMRQNLRALRSELCR